MSNYYTEKRRIMETKLWKEINDNVYGKKGTVLFEAEPEF
jgi:hypothetical protein